MSITLATLDAWLADRENEHLEFKEAKNQYSYRKLLRYCAALANERGGSLVLGVTDKRPRRVVGTKAFEDHGSVCQSLLEQLHLRVRAEEVHHPYGRVLVFTVPSRPLGAPIEIDGAYLMRAGGSLTGMTHDVLARIFAEVAPDFSAEPCTNATLDDLEIESIQAFQRAWSRKSGNRTFERIPPEQALEDAELLLDGQVTNAALVLFGKRRSLGRLLPQAEVVFEYRSSGTPGAAQQRMDHREGFFGFHDALWNAIDARNDIQHYQEGLFVWDVPTFHESSVREALLNAVAHRDYRLQNSVFIRQHPQDLVIESPGGLPPGVTVDDILWKQAPRNRRICEAFQRCGLVERSGQGMDRIYEECIRNGKPLPSFVGTDDYQVVVTLRGGVEDPRTIQFLERIGQERLASFTTAHFLTVDAVRRGDPLDERLQRPLQDLLEQGIVERPRRGRYVLSRRLYAFLGKKGEYTRKVGLDKGQNKALLLKHIRDNRAEGSRMAEFMEVLPSLTRHQIGRLLKELREGGEAHYSGKKRATRWYPGSDLSGGRANGES